MNRYVSMALVLFLWGLWGLLPKLAVGHINPKSAMFYQALGGFLVAVCVLWSMGARPDVHWPSIGYSVTAGGVAILGSLLLLQLMRSESASIAVSVTALYPVVTILLAMMLLDETVTIKQGIGMLFSFAALVLLVG